MVKNIDNSVNESLSIGQAVLVGWLQNPSRVTADRQSETWSTWALGREACSKNKRHSPIRLGSCNLGNICGRGTKVCEELRRGRWMHAAYKKMEKQRCLFS